MTPQDYSRQVVFIDGRQLVQLESFDSETESGQQPVILLNEGLAGFTPGGGQTTMTGVMYVPIGGFEEPVQEWCVEGSYHTIQQGIGPKAMVTTGKFTNVKIGQSTNQATQVNFTFVGQKKAFE